VENYTKEELLEELHDEELHDEEPEESGDDPTPALLDAEKNEEVIDTLTGNVLLLCHKMILMQTLNLLKVMMMKVAHQMWMIWMTMEVRNKMKLDRSLMMLHTR
jgi:hypothetical protein